MLLTEARPCSVDFRSQHLVDPFAPLPLQKLLHYYESIRPLTVHRYCRAYEVFSLVTSRLTSPLKFPRSQHNAYAQVTPPVRRVLLGQSCGLLPSLIRGTLTTYVSAPSIIFDESSAVHLHSSP